MSAIKIEVRGDKELYAKFMRINDLGYQDTFDDIGKELVSIFGNEAFASQGGAIGQSWPALAPSTLKQKSKSWSGRPPLERTGEMKGAFDAQASDTQVVVTNSSDKFAYHQGKQRSGKLPRRPMMGKGGVVEGRVKPIFRQGVMQKVRQAWAM